MNLALKVRIIEVFGYQADFGEALDLHESVVSKVVRDRRKLPRSEQIRWAKALKCSREEIFKGH